MSTWQTSWSRLQRRPSCPPTSGWRPTSSSPPVSATHTHTHTNRVQGLLLALLLVFLYHIILYYMYIGIIFGRSQIFRFWLKTIVRRFGQISLLSRNSSLEGTRKLKFVSSADLCMPFPVESFLAKVKNFRFWPNTMGYSQVFWSISLRSHNSSLEGARKLKFASFCSSLHALSDGIILGQSQKFPFLAEYHGL